MLFNNFLYCDYHHSIYTTGFSKYSCKVFDISYPADHQALILLEFSDAKTFSALFL